MVREDKGLFGGLAAQKAPGGAKVPVLEEMTTEQLEELAGQMDIAVQDGESRTELLQDIINNAVEHSGK